MDYAVFVLEGNNSDLSSPSLLKWVEFVRRVKVLPNLILLPLAL